MKMIFLIVTVASLSLVSCAQHISSAKVPSVVQNTVQSTFANAADIEWEKKNDVYEAEFDMGKTEYSAYIDATGKLLSYKLDIPATEVPAAIVTAINTGHAGYRIDDVDKIEKDGFTYYQVELEASGKKDIQLVFSPDGKTATGLSYLN